jgi:hypothetical protein
MKKSIILILLLFYFLHSSNFAGAEVIVESKYLEILPNGRTTGSILENWMNNVVFFQVESGGLSRIDPARFSADGISWIEQNFRINGVDVTDPFKSGYPLFEPAWESIKSLEVKSVQENDPHRTGINWTIRTPEDYSPVYLSYNNIFPVYDKSLIPKGSMDREPSFDYGSPDKTRRYKSSNEANCILKFTDNIYAGAEALVTRREFPTLSDLSGKTITEEAEKYSVTASYINKNAFLPFSLLLISQYNENNNFGANLRLDHNDTLTQQAFVNHLQFAAEKVLDKGKLYFHSGITVKSEKLSPHLIRPGITDLIADSGPVPASGEINRVNFDNNIIYNNKLIKIDGEFQLNAVNYKPEIPYSQTMQSLNGGIFSVTVWDNTKTCNEYVTNTKINSALTKTWDAFSLSGNLYVDNANASANGKQLLNWYGFGGKISPKYIINKTSTGLQLCALHQPAKLNSNIVEFLEKDRPSGQTYSNWIDSNSNGVAEASELAGAALVSTTGGNYHHKYTDLKRPYHDEFSAIIEQPLGTNLKIITHCTHRIFSDYFIVNYDRYNGTYSTTPEGYVIYNKPSGTDQYYLSNYTGKPAHYSGIGIQLLWESEKVYFNFMLRAFMVKGYAPAGNGPDYNDYAVITEDSASPDNRINANGGRMSSDRAYMANILFAYMIKKELSFGLTLKYRDGEPYSQYRVYYDTNGMPVKVMNQKRGDWYNKGIGRYTFAWNLDIRLRYTPKIMDKNIGITFDIYNVLGSSTELLESSDLQDDRLALEAVPQRMIKLGADMKF